MPWSTTTDVDAFIAAAGEFLRERPVDHTVLLTEAAYSQVRGGEGRYRWYETDDGEVAGAFLQAPRHPPVLSMMPDEALASIVDGPPLDVDGRLAERVAEVWRRRGRVLTVRSRVTLHRCEEPPGVSAPGRARVATVADRPLLVHWYERLMADNPDDPSELAYVVDDPLSYGGITLWEVDGVPVAMAGRSREVAGMVRLGAVYAPDDPAYGDAAFAAACQDATAAAREVLVFGQPGDDRYRDLGFVPVLDRVLLAG